MRSRNAGGHRRLDQRRRAPDRHRGPHAASISASTTGTGSAATSTASSTCMPSGRYLMEDFYYAGGLPVVMRDLGERGLLHKDALTVNGKTIWREHRRMRRAGTARWSPPSTSRSSRRPASRSCAAISRPNGAVIKPSAASPELMQHTGRAVVFEIDRGPARAHRRRCSRHRRDLHHGAQELRPEGLSGHGRGRQHAAAAEAAASRASPTWSASPMRACRGTAYGTVVLHVAPEAAAGGPLALVQNGDMITLDVAGASACICTWRTRSWRAGAPPGCRPMPHASRGYGQAVCRSRAAGG